MPEYAGRARDKVASDLVVLTPQEDEAVLFQARLNDVRMFYVGFAFRGDVAYGGSGGKADFGYEQAVSMFVRQTASGWKLTFLTQTRRSKTVPKRPPTPQASWAAPAVQGSAARYWVALCSEKWSMTICATTSRSNPVTTPCTQPLLVSSRPNTLKAASTAAL